MIVYDLECGDGHRFEGWFASKSDFVAQGERGLVSCPTCGVQEVRRIPSITRFNSGAIEPKEKSAPAQPAEFAGKDPAAIAQILYSRFVDEMLQKSEDVGKALPGGSTQDSSPRKRRLARSRGEATNEEQRGHCQDEGICRVASPGCPPPGLDWN
jgi:hypothetical protein